MIQELKEIIERFLEVIPESCLYDDGWYADKKTHKTAKQCAKIYIEGQIELLNKINGFTNVKPV